MGGDTRSGGPVRPAVPDSAGRSPPARFPRTVVQMSAPRQTPAAGRRIAFTLLARLGRAALFLVQVVVVLAAYLWLVSRGWDLAALVLAGVAIYVLAERSVRDHVPLEPSPASPAAATPPAPSAVAADVERVLAWSRTALAERVPARGPFPPLSEVLQPQSPPLAGLGIRLTVAHFQGSDPAENDVRTVEIRVQTADDSSIRTDLDLGTAAEVIERIDAGERTPWVTRLLERAGPELRDGVRDG